MLSTKPMLLSVFLLGVVILHSTTAFMPASSLSCSASRRTSFRHLNNAAGGNEEAPTEKMSLEEKMKGWEASEEEIKAASLGGIVPGRSDAFDVGLYIAFPLMVISGLIFALFPLIMGNIDTSEFGPPPTM